MNRGTISQVLRGLRHCSPEDRHCALMVVLNFNAAEQQKFLPARERHLFRNSLTLRRVLHHTAVTTYRYSVAVSS